jgi:hypothetical protein
MLTNSERYFIWNIIHPCNELRTLIGLSSQPIYHDDKYSILKERIGLLCTKVLHVFEQPEFSSLYGKTKREELNKNDSKFHRVLSYGIKEKHGSINNQYYSSYNLSLPLSAYAFSSELKYDYFYHPTLNNDTNDEFSLLEDLTHVINSLIRLYGLNINEIECLFKPSTKYTIANNTINIHLVDIYGYFDNGKTESINLRTFEFSNNKWTPAYLPFQKDFKCLAYNQHKTD